MPFFTGTDYISLGKDPMEFRQGMDDVLIIGIQEDDIWHENNTLSQGLIGILVSGHQLYLRGMTDNIGKLFKHEAVAFHQHNIMCHQRNTPS